MQRVSRGEDCIGPVVAIDMQKRADAFHRIGRIRQSQVDAVDLVVAAANVEFKLVTRNSAEAARIWMSRLSPEQVKHIRSGTEAEASSFYSSSDWATEGV